MMSVSPSRLRAIARNLCLSFLFWLAAASPALAQSLAQSGDGGGFNPQLLLRDALQSIQDLGALGAIAFILLYIVATVAFLPGSFVTLGAGVVFGVLWGSCYVFIGAVLGSTLAFLIGRYLARDWIARKIAGKPKFAAIDDAVGREGFKIVLLTRLSPVFPFNLLNYAYGITNVSLKDYVLGSVGMIPGTMMYVYIGSLAGSLATLGTEAPAEVDPQAMLWQRGLQVVGFVATVAVTLYVTRLARQALADRVGDAAIDGDTANETASD